MNAGSGDAQHPRNHTVTLCADRSCLQTSITLLSSKPAVQTGQQYMHSDQEPTTDPGMRQLIFNTHTTCQHAYHLSMQEESKDRLVMTPEQLLRPGVLGHPSASLWCSSRSGSGALIASSGLAQVPYLHPPSWRICTPARGNTQHLLPICPSLLNTSVCLTSCSAGQPACCNKTRARWPARQVVMQTHITMPAKCCTKPDCNSHTALQKYSGLAYREGF